MAGAWRSSCAAAIWTHSAMPSCSHAAPRYDSPSSDGYVGRSPEGTRAGLGAARRPARFDLMRTKSAHRYHVYVVELDDRVWNEPSFRRANPDHEMGKPYVYVG